MTGIKNVNFSVWHVLPIALRFAENERQIVLTQMTSNRGGFSRIHACHFGYESMLVR